MKVVCSVCNRIGIDRNILCTEINCPINKHFILGNGQIVGDVKVIELQQITQSYAIYQGIRGKETVLLKVAHNNKGARNQLIGEAQFLANIAEQRIRQSRNPLRFLVSQEDAFPGIPNLQAAYVNARLMDFPYGDTVVNGNDISFMVWDMIEGIPLRQYLSATPEPWFDNVAHAVNRLAYVLNLIGKANLVHGKLTPEAVWVFEDERGILRPTLVDFGLLQASNNIEAINLIWLHEFSNVAYIAPEILRARNSEIEDYRPVNPEAIDVYGLGILLYEMLAGHPKYTYGLRSRSQIVKDINRDVDRPLVRDDIAGTTRKPLIDLANNASDIRLEKRPGRIENMITSIEKTVGKVPPDKVPNTTGQIVWRIALSVGIIVGIYLLIGVAVSQ